MQFCKALLVILCCLQLVACKEPQDIDLEFIPVYQGVPLACDDFLPLEQHTGWQINTLQFFIANIARERAGDSHSLTLLPSVNSNARLGLVGGQCRVADYWRLTAQGEALSAGDVLSFDLGVPFALNHANPLTAEAPLDQADMFWSWQMGHKFFRLDLVNAVKGDTFSFHLGSTGCDAVSSLRAPTMPCQHANLYRIKIADFNPDKPILVDLAVLLAGTQLMQENRCMSDVNTPSCQRLFEQLQHQKVFYQ
ncbi:MbnP family copper-binding protein [Pseudoalteromonas ulvae]|uniref:MbnP family copper-binding protein n=1 Tax=Pseudoalteromonas ulvae TaxID=107327 RepID=UPI001593041F|nr:MbnP family copper-binding protein [Pseudoalteromonas ulvae]